MRLATAVAERTEPRSHLGSLATHASDASEFLKALAHPTRLLILSILCEGERSVTELEQLLALRQPTVSQQLARLREDGLVKTRRQGKTIYYSLGSNDARIVVEAVSRMFGSRRSAAVTPPAQIPKSRP
jgi:ArsR family transcriptional regulator, virulence genes transcriptional regulator